MELFDLQRAYGLTAEENEILMANAHGEEFLGSLQVTPEANRVVRKMVNAGHEVTVITGRPVSTAEYSLAWLERNGFPALPFRCLDKYNRWFMGGAESPYYLSREEFAGMRFDLFVDDSPAALKMLSQRNDGKVFIFNRPWNRKVDANAPRMTRIGTWLEIEKRIEEMG